MACNELVATSRPPDRKISAVLTLYEVNPGYVSALILKCLIEQFYTSHAHFECLLHAEVGNRKACNIRIPEIFNSTQCAAEFPDAYAVTYWTHGWRKS